RQPEISETDRVVFGQAATPEQNVAANRASYERLTEGMTQEQIDADPDLVRMREQIEGVTVDPVQQPDVFMEPEQAEIVNNVLQEQGFTPEGSTSFLQELSTEEGRNRIKQSVLDRLGRADGQPPVDFDDRSEER